MEKCETQCVRVCLPVKNHCGVCVCFVVTSLCELQGAVLRDVTYNLRFLSIPACFMQVCLSPSAHTGVKKAWHNMSLTHFVFYNENNNTIVICSPPVNQGHTFEINQVSKSCWNTLFLVEMRPKCCWYIILPSPHQIRWLFIKIYHQSWMDDLFSDQRTEEESCPCPNLWHSVTLTSEAENHNIILTCCKCNHYILFIDLLYFLYLFFNLRVDLKNKKINTVIVHVLPQMLSVGP